MNYERLYTNLIEHAKAREVPTCYIEKHHILPKALGGLNENANIVVLTAREHFIAHWCIAKFSKAPAMWLALTRMRYQHAKKGEKCNSRLYAIARQRHVEYVSMASKGARKGADAKWAKPNERQIESARQKQIQKALTQAPGYVEKMSEATKRGMQKAGITPAEISKRTKMAMQRPEVRAKMLEGMRRARERKALQSG